MALANAVGDKVEAAYRRGDLFERHRHMMTAWATLNDLKRGACQPALCRNPLKDGDEWQLRAQMRDLELAAGRLRQLKRGSE